VGMKWFWEARGYGHEALDWFKAVLALPGQVEPELRRMTLDCGSGMAWQTGVFELSRLWLAEALTLSRSVGRTDWEAHTLMQLGKVGFEQGQYQEALQALKPALTLSRLLNTPWLLSAILFQLAETTLALGNQNEAQTYAEEGLELCRHHPGFFWEPLLLRFFGGLALERQDFSSAKRFFSESLSLAKNIKHMRVISLILAYFAASLTPLNAENVNLLRAARLWGAVEAIRETNGHLWSPANREWIKRWIEQTRKRVPDLEWNLAWISGRSMTLPEAIELAQTKADRSEKARVRRL